MTPPRLVLPDTNVEITQRTLGREFRFLPNAEITNLVLYVLGVGAQRYGVSLYGFVLMVTHYHLAARDVRGNMPDFVRYVNSLLARALNARQGECDKLWSGSGYVAVRPQSRDDLLGRLVYGLANPAAAGLVNRVEDFPGLVITPAMIGVDLEATRPDFFFSDKSTLPERVTVRFEIPPEFEAMGIERYRSLLWERLREREAEHREERKRADVSVVGAKRLRQVACGQRSTSWEQWFTLKPTIAAKLRADRLAAIGALRQFRAQYREAWERWRGGDRATRFPAGTWWVVVYAGAAVVG
jgi:putative transposase